MQSSIAESRSWIYSRTQERPKCAIERPATSVPRRDFINISLCVWWRHCPPFPCLNCYLDSAARKRKSSWFFNRLGNLPTSALVAYSRRPEPRQTRGFLCFKYNIEVRSNETIYIQAIPSGSVVLVAVLTWNETKAMSTMILQDYVNYLIRQLMNDLWLRNITTIFIYAHIYIFASLVFFL